MTIPVIFVKITVTDVTVHTALSVGVGCNLRTAMNGISMYGKCHREEAAGESLRRNVQNRPGSFCMKVQRKPALKVKE